CLFSFNAPSSPEIYPLSLHDALPILGLQANTHTVPILTVPQDSTTAHHPCYGRLDRYCLSLQGRPCSFQRLLFGPDPMLHSRLLDRLRSRSKDTLDPHLVGRRIITIW